MTTDDAEAIARTLNGDREAYGFLVARYTVPAHRAATLLGAGSDAEDVVQEAFVKAYAKLRSFRTDQEFRPWLLRIVVNETKNLNRSRTRRWALAVRVESEDGRSERGGPTAADPQPEAVALAAERHRVLVEALESLADKERRVLVCRYFLELGEAETATALGWPRGTVKSRTYRALAKLRALLGDSAEQDVPDV